MLNNIVIVIPSLDPDMRLIRLLADIRMREKSNVSIIVVNDGSEPQYDSFFQEAEQDYHVILLKHERNLGKGAALKTAIKFFLAHFPMASGIVTIDSDGQHLFKDVFKCVSVFLSHPNSLVLGVRNFNKGIPLRSRFGNLLTSRVVHFFSGTNISDTQTGLRVISKDFCKDLLAVQGDRFEFEMNMLLEAKKKGVSIIQCAISTIYLDDNKSSHFRVIRDSLAIYGPFLKFIGSSFVAFLLDVAFFSLAMAISPVTSLLRITIASVLARIFSSLVNYVMNRKMVFKEDSRNSVFKYYLLVLIQVCLSSYLVAFLHAWLLLNVVLIKIIVDFFLFFFSFFVQRNIIFRKRGSVENENQN